MLALRDFKKNLRSFLIFMASSIVFLVCIIQCTPEYEVVYVDDNEEDEEEYYDDYYDDDDDDDKKVKENNNERRFKKNKGRGRGRGRYTSRGGGGGSSNNNNNGGSGNGNDDNGGSGNGNSGNGNNNNGGSGSSRVTTSRADLESLLQTHIERDFNYDFSARESAAFWSCMQEPHSTYTFTGEAKICILLSQCSNRFCTALSSSNLANFISSCADAIGVSNAEYSCRPLRSTSGDDDDDDEEEEDDDDEEEEDDDDDEEEDDDDDNGGSGSGQTSCSGSDRENLLQLHIGSRYNYNFCTEESQAFQTCLEGSLNFWDFTGLAKACTMLSQCSSDFCRNLSRSDAETFYPLCAEAIGVTESEYACDIRR